MSNIWNIDGRYFHRLAAGFAMACMAGAAYAADEVAPTTTEPLTIDDGAKAMVCEKVGFLAILRDADGRLSSPQFPAIEIRYSDGLFALIEAESEVQGLQVPYTTFIRYHGPETWILSGFEGTTPFIDSCRDITADLAFSFSKIAFAASWGIPHINERANLFAALEDDLRTRLELATLEKEELAEANLRLVGQIDEISGELAEVRLVACELAGVADTLVVEAALGGPSGEDKLLEGCVDDAVYVRSDGASAQ